MFFFQVNLSADAPAHIPSTSATEEQAHREAAGVSIGRKMRCLLKGKADAVEEMRNIVANEDPLKRASNLHFLLALERLLKGGVGVELSEFMYAKPVAALPLGVKRYLVPFEWPQDEGCVRLRSCLEDKRVNKNHYEVPLRMVDGKILARTLHIFIDQCSKGWHCGVWLFSGQPRLRGSCWFDRLHTLLNVNGEAKSDARLALLDMEWTTAMQATRGPWKSHSHKHLMRRMAERLFEAITIEDEVFEILYFDMSVQLGTHNGAEFGTRRHKQKTLDAARIRFLSNGLGAGAVRERWFSQQLAYDDCRDLIATNLLVLLFWGLEAQKWSCLEESPLMSRLNLAPGAAMMDDASDGDEDDDAECVDHVEGTGNPEAKRQTLAQARAELRAIRKKVQEQLKFAASVYACPFGTKMQEALWRLEKPIQEQLLRNSEAKKRIKRLKILELMTKRTDAIGVLYERTCSSRRSCLMAWGSYHHLQVTIILRVSICG